MRHFTTYFLLCCAILLGCSGQSNPSLALLQDAHQGTDLQIEDTLVPDDIAVQDSAFDSLDDAFVEILDLDSEDSYQDTTEILDEVLEVLEVFDSTTDTDDVSVPNDTKDAVFEVVEDSTSEILETVEDDTQLTDIYEVADVSEDILSDVGPDGEVIEDTTPEDTYEDTVEEDVGPLNPCTGLGYGATETACFEDYLVTCSFGSSIDSISCGDLEPWWNNTCIAGECVVDPFYAGICTLTGLYDEDTGEALEKASCINGEFILCLGTDVMEIDTCLGFSDPCADDSSCYANYPRVQVPCFVLECDEDHECKNNTPEDCCWNDDQCNGWGTHCSTCDNYHCNDEYCCYFDDADCPPDRPVCEGTTCVVQ